MPEEIASKKRRYDRIRRMLETVPANRRWSRRGWLVICRVRWLARAVEWEKRSVALLDYIPDCATNSKKRRGKMADQPNTIKIG